jgi:PiT family inorganic phosphate transporter
MSIAIGTLIFLLAALAIALGFECINGFHDTANAVATVIYTNSLKAQPAVVWSGLWNFLGVLLGGIAVAFSIVHLLPVDLLVHIDTGAGMAMVLALLIGATTWNFGTWYMGIPASSSHTLIGAIIGVGLANSFLAGHFGTGVNWHKAGEIGLSLFLSPLIGFGLAYILLIVLKYLAPNPKLHVSPAGDSKPPWWVRGILIATCTGVGFAHGSNDGQKGIGLIMLILIGLVPAHYALNMSQTPEEFQAVCQAAERLEEVLTDPQLETALVAQQRNTARRLAWPWESGASAAEDAIVGPPPQDRLESPDLHTTQELVDSLRTDLKGKTGPQELHEELRWQIRTKILMVENALTKLQGLILPVLSKEKALILNQSRSKLRSNVEYAPTWVLVAVAVALGVGTMVGWKRIVVTVGEKIGRTHLTYSQGASAELVAASTIGMADVLGMPVSTTQVLSSGVAGTMCPLSWVVVSFCSFACSFERMVRRVQWVDIMKGKACRLFWSALSVALSSCGSFSSDGAPVCVSDEQARQPGRTPSYTTYERMDDTSPFNIGPVVGPASSCSRRARSCCVGSHDPTPSRSASWPPCKWSCRRG